MNWRRRYVVLWAVVGIVIFPHFGFSKAADAACASRFAKLMLSPKSDPVLRQVATPIEDSEITSADIADTIEQMRQIMKARLGAGLAASQVGRSIQLAIAKTKEFGELVMINPKLNSLDGGERLSFEACLSLPSQCGLVSRRKKVEVEFKDIEGKTQRIEASGFDAIVLQHEIDHLNGVLYTDRSGATAKAIGNLGRWSLRKLDSDGKVILSKFLAELQPQEAQAFQKHFSKSLAQDINDIGRVSSVANALMSGREISSPNAALGEILSAYKILLSSARGDLKNKQLTEWVKSDTHALYLANLMGRLEIPTVSSELAYLKNGNPNFAFLRLPGIRGPPNDDITKLFSIGGKAFHFGSIDETIEFAKLADKYKLRLIDGDFEFQIRQNSTVATLRSNDLETVRVHLRLVDQQGNLDALSSSVKIGSERFLGGDRRKRITFGLESEMNFRENPALLDDYRLKTVTDEQWEAMTEEGRLRAVEQVIQTTERKGTFPFVKTRTAPSWVPETMDAEMDGNSELRGAVFDNIDAVRVFVEAASRRYPHSYWQGHVVFPKQNSVDGLVGYSVIEGDIAQLKSLESGYAKHLGSPDFVPGRFLSHHSLGPLSDSDRAMYAKMEEKARNGGAIGDGGGARVHNGPALRDDKYPRGHVGFELRQFHQRGEQLVDEMDALSTQLHLAGTMSGLAPAAKTELVSDRLLTRLKDFPSVAPDVKAWKKFFGTVEESVGGKNPDLLIGAAPVSQRFFLPMRNWVEHPAIKDAIEAMPDKGDALRARINTATRTYIELVSGIVARHARGELTVDQATNLSQTAVARWAFDTKLSSFLQNFKSDKLLTKNSSLGEVIAASPKLKLVKSEAIGDRANVLGTISQGTEKKFSSGQRYVEYKIPQKLTATKSEWQSFQENSVEVMYEPTGPFGHIRLRVGSTVYSFNFSKDATLHLFDPSKNKATDGYAFVVPKEDIAKVQKEIDRIYYNSSLYNVPPFDPYSHQMRLSSNRENPRFRRPTSSIYSLMSTNGATGRIVTRDGRKFFQTPDNLFVPLEEHGEGVVCMQSFSCSSSANHILKKFFGIDLDVDRGAKGMREQLEAGSSMNRTPDVVLRYK